MPFLLPPLPPDPDRGGAERPSAGDGRWRPRGRRRLGRRGNGEEDKGI
jgi:hypothetical protein